MRRRRCAPGTLTPSGLSAGAGAERRRIEEIEKLRGAQVMEEAAGQFWMVLPSRVQCVEDVYTPTVS